MELVSQSVSQSVISLNCHKSNQVKLSLQIKLSSLSLETVIQSLIECIDQRFTQCTLKLQQWFECFAIQTRVNVDKFELAIAL